MLLSALRRHISKKWCFEKYCSRDKVYQFSALYDLSWQCYLKKMTNDEKYKQTSSTFYVSNNESSK